MLYLEHAGFSVTVASDGPRGLALAAAPDVSLVILDLMIPGLSGADVCRQLRATSAVPVVMVTARASEGDRVAGLELGADDYVTKPFSPREVVARVNALLRRTAAQPMPARAIVVGDLEIDLWAHQARISGQTVDLTPTEFKLLEALGRAPTRSSLATNCSPARSTRLDGLDRTVNMHVTNLRRSRSPRPPALRPYGARPRVSSRAPDDL